ncbi:spermidine/putrescine transport system permease protein [Tistlia consotensis]|uniref:Spermidine/putrescine transport system permease protein PotC n=1 Tax=Tistlia consotensis USBA 355 TaxID=560819 RepID=A0A1Y6B5X9_9PROT|nr:ABC transporter permease [Tistlia consotensis]SME89565.1 spermidine/putrescine transport system permease protein [Tistlia consotensis USBA 355]SNR26069.1 spermidine/putrescine transport system permease protein [Tistlia consotensis]
MAEATAARAAPARRRRKGFQTRRFPGLATFSAIFFGYLYLPIVILVALSFNANRTATIWTGFTTGWYGRALANGDMLQAAGNSLTIAVSAMVLSTVLATLGALGMSRRRFRGRTGVTALLSLPLIVPEIVTAVATLLFFVALGLQLGLATVILAHTVFCIPFAYLPIRARLEDMDPALREAAADLYANEWKSFLRVILPLLLPGILSGAMLAFIISLDDFVITFFTAGAGSTTLPVYIFSLIRMGVTPEVNAISALMLLISITFVSLSFVLASGKHRI